MDDTPIGMEEEETIKRDFLAAELLKMDKNLEAMRYKLVPLRYVWNEMHLISLE